MTAEEKVEYERLVSAARSQADPLAFDAAWNEGCSMTAAQAIEYAQRDDPATGRSPLAAPGGSDHGPDV